MLLPLSQFRRVELVGDTSDAFLLRQPRQGNSAPFRIERIGQVDRASRTRIGIAGGVRKNHDRRFEPLGAMHGHHPHQPPGVVRLTFELALARVEPVEEADEAGRRSRGVRACRVEQFIDGVVGFAAKARDKLAAALPRPGQEPVQQHLRRIEIGLVEQCFEAFPRFGD